MRRAGGEAGGALRCAVEARSRPRAARVGRMARFHGCLVPGGMSFCACSVPARRCAGHLPQLKKQVPGRLSPEIEEIFLSWGCKIEFPPEVPPEIEESFIPWGCKIKCPPKAPPEIDEIFMPWGCKIKCPPKVPPEIEEIFIPWGCASKCRSRQPPEMKKISKPWGTRRTGNPPAAPEARLPRQQPAGRALRCPAAPTAPAACRPLHPPSTPSAMRRHSAIFPCFFLSVTTVLFSSPANASTSLARVSSGRITSSTKPQDAAK